MRSTIDYYRGGGVRGLGLINSKPFLSYNLYLAFMDSWLSPDSSSGLKCSNSSSIKPPSLPACTVIGPLNLCNVKGVKRLRLVSSNHYVVRFFMWTVDIGFISVRGRMSFRTALLQGLNKLHSLHISCLSIKIVVSLIPPSGGSTSIFLPPVVKPKFHHIEHYFVL